MLIGWVDGELRLCSRFCGVAEQGLVLRRAVVTRRLVIPVGSHWLEYEEDLGICKFV